jgi:hypothetical protein
MTKTEALTYYHETLVWLHSLSGNTPDEYTAFKGGTTVATWLGLDGEPERVTLRQPLDASSDEVLRARALIADRMPNRPVTAEPFQFKDGHGIQTWTA